jgi:hypothetical protein
MKRNKVKHHGVHQVLNVSAPIPCEDLADEAKRLLSDTVPTTQTTIEAADGNA